MESIFRKEQFLPRLAQFYLREDTKESLKWFGNPQGTFPVAVEGDRCPFGKNKEPVLFYQVSEISVKKLLQVMRILSYLVPTVKNPVQL